jgi:tRNA nucleotidyltransferase (CCA-adding enzyme)
MLDTISGDRIRHELELMLKEKQPEKGLSRACELGVLQKIHPSLNGDGWLGERYTEARELGLPESSLAVVYLALLLNNLRTSELEEIYQRLHFNKTVNQTLKDTLLLKEILSVIDSTEIAPSEIYFALCKFTPLAIIAKSLAIDSPTVEQHIDLYLTKLRHIKSRLNGDDLKRMQIPAGPEIKRILHLLHVARLDGKVNTKQGEIRQVSLQGYSPTNNGL